MASEANQLSDTHLKHVHDLLELMSEAKWGGVFIKWREHDGAAKKYPPPKYKAAGFGSEKEQLADLHGIHWGQMQDAAKRLGDQAKKGSPLAGNVKKLTGDLDAAWSGKAADKALEQYHSLAPSIQDYCDTAKRFASELDKASRVPQNAINGHGVNNIFSDPKHNSGFWKNYQDDQSDDMLKDIEGMHTLVSGANLAVNTAKDVAGAGNTAFGKKVESRAVAAIARANGVSEAKVRRCAGGEDTDILDDAKIQLTWDDLRVHGSPKTRGEPGDYNFERSGTPAHERIKWLDDFAGWYARDIDALRKRIDDCHQKTSDAWLALTTSMEGLDTDPFGKGKPGGEPPAQPAESQAAGTGQPTGSSPTGGGPTGGGPTGGGPTGGGTVGGGGPAGAGGTGAPGGGTAAAAAPPGGMPKPGEMPQSPQVPQSPQMPQPPETQTPAEGGPPGAAPPGSSAPGGPQGDQITVGDGPNQVTVNEPGPNGNVRLTVMGENGQPQSYEIGFGQPGVSGPQALPGQVPGPAGPPGEQLAGGAPGTAPPPNAGTPPVGQGGPTQVPVGPDGSAVIEVGERTITVEQTQSGELQVTMDNGDGSPQDYTVDFDEDQESGPQQPFIPAQAPQPTPAMPSDQPAPVAEQPPTSRDTPQAAGPAQSAAQAAGTDAGTPGGSGSTSSYASAVADPAMSVAGGAVSGGAADQAPVDTSAVPASTTPQWGGFSSMSGFTGEGMQNSFASASGNLFNPADGGGSPWAQPGGQQGPGGSSGATGLAGMGETRSTSSQGATGLASMGDAGGGSSGEQSSSGMRGGMMPMGGMGGAGGQQGGDEERSNDSPWRTQGGDLFDDGLDGGNGFQYRAVFGQDGEK